MYSVIVDNFVQGVYPDYEMALASYNRWVERYEYGMYAIDICIIHDGKVLKRNYGVGGDI